MDFDDPDYDAKFEFDAPRYYDFQAINEGTPGDKWFDTAPDGPGCKADRSAGVVLREPLKAIQQEPAADRPQNQDRKTSSNIVTSWGQGAMKKVTCSNLEQNSALGPRPKPSSNASAANPAAGMQPTAELSAQGAGAEAVSAAAAADVIPSRRLTRKSLVAGARRVCSSATAGAHTEPPVTRSMSRLGHQLCSPVPEGKRRCRASPPMTRSRKCVTAIKARATSARTKPVPHEKVRHVLEPKVIKPARSTKPLTLPDDFELETDKRLAAKAAATTKVGDDVGKSPFKSLAEKVREFQSKTPVRFKSKPQKPAAAHQQHQQPSITDAKSPLLMTSRRARPSMMKSRQQLEEEELERLRNEQFRAKPVDMRVLTSSGQLGVPKLDKPKPTEPRPFHLRSDSRARVRQSHEHPSMEQAAAAATKFRAQPLNRSILDGPTFKPQKEKVEVTVPKSPLLRTKLRSHSAAKDEESKKVRPSSAPKERSCSGSINRPLSGHSTGSSKGLTAAAAAAACGGKPQLTEPKPFQLQTEARGALHQNEMAAKLAAEAARAKRLRRVTARPLPVTVDVPLIPPKPEPKPLTLPQPFELRSLARHETFEEERKRKLQEEDEAARQAAEFKARPMHAGAPFTVHESDALLTVPEELHLATEERAIERQTFDIQVAEKIRQEEEEKKRREELKRKQEEEATREYRKKLRFSARPMPSFDQPYYAMPSDKPLTNPKTPNFASKKLKKAT